MALLSLNSVGKQIVEECTRKLTTFAQNFKNQAGDAGAAKFFDVKGDVIVFKNTDDLAKSIHAHMVKGRKLLREAIVHVRRAADDLRRKGLSMTVQLAARGFKGYSSQDPTVARLMEALAYFSAADMAGTWSGELATLLHKLADLMEKAAKKMDRSQLSVRFAVWVPLKGNAFNLKTRRFEAQGLSPLARMSNWKFNPRIAALESKLRLKGPSFSTRCYTEWFVKTLVGLGIAMGLAATGGELLGMLWEGMWDEVI